MRKFVVLAAVVLAAVGAVAPGGTAQAASAGTVVASCDTPWGSLPKETDDRTWAFVVNARGGRHECFDRLVVDLGPGAVTGYRVQYVPQVIQDGSGDPVPLDGGAFLEVILRAPDWDSTTGEQTYRPPDRLHAVDVTGYDTFRQVAHVGGFEGDTTFGVGVRARLPFRVFTLTGPGGGSRLVLDVAHHW